MAVVLKTTVPERVPGVRGRPMESNLVASPAVGVVAIDAQSPINCAHSNCACFRLLVASARWRHLVAFDNARRQ
jgi:hypothetical protein